ncbi:MAG: hypothetical protein A3C49_02750 [Candidatus Doudnabacteria bacterium RIFCSPHIGHO2_02_FULL_42_25]|uniref:Uncharacterized protein n=1 Tax=Candidatus Doudnabacteria bacterium RIFCSPHIGHO2_01_FULL_41_86 TaxID=1817821 RepID=A0A1F5N9L2_9BACT|nr:MAG: hypothetical protein A2717_02345 [Candidatus Doudnabacteria bacterium RIFCSPHIGHO2_01_FULL_41_86]OGE75601.1 MAG: hypothetical protein A3K07_02105 [Candidatus Doudnabacteria bacterium RIFCSPHIGHO2_01_43_10]OGE85396.1 MAG: hypothetical protein A3E28_01915 [Candidatus Doudnabacteria bacterium RIFCSPHIGHO2_12_FULL_42_22]OGE86934.1 MAG: hypothetical protein A3C49_02750 [Candidatus Doudnabacteria bacterium RIFCSPHIGHO2_02_FULL_42_25]OGE92533.1 MAG: hypothetical protein A2895_02905 [Candidatus
MIVWGVIVLVIVNAVAFLVFMVGHRHTRQYDAWKRQQGTRVDIYRGNPVRYLRRNSAAKG